jgi:hypothetical protein
VLVLLLLLLDGSNDHDNSAAFSDTATTRAYSTRRSSVTLGHTGTTDWPTNEVTALRRDVKLAALHRNAGAMNDDSGVPNSDHDTDVVTRAGSALSHVAGNA